MRIIVSGDWQADVGNLDRLSIVVDQVVAECGRDPKTFFVHLGDAKEKTNPVDLRVINFLQDAFMRIRKSCSGFFYVRGNHDNINTQDGSPSLCDLVRAWGALGVADDVWEGRVVPIIGWRGTAGMLRLYFVPYFRDPERQRKEFDGALGHVIMHTNAGDVKLLFFHQTVTGTMRGAQTADGLSASDMGADKYDACFGGHEHMPQVLKPNIHVVGSPMAIDWGEVNYRHRIMTVTIPEGKRK